MNTLTTISQDVVIATSLWAACTRATLSEPKVARLQTHATIPPTSMEYSTRLIQRPNPMEDM